MKALGLFILMVGFSRRCDAQFPRVCTNDASLKSKVCCPIPKGFTEPCGGPGRGQCANTPDPTVEDAAWKYAYQVDDRRHWPTVFFNRTCACEGNFSGYDCTKCTWGYREPDCKIKQKPAVRRNIRDLSAQEKKTLQRYFDRAKNTISDFVYALEFKDNIGGSEDFANVSVWDFFVATHYYASRDTMPPAITDICANESDCILDFAHEGVGFPTWHRAYLLEFERAVQEVNDDPDWTVPYWDWSAAEDNQCDICTNEYVGKNDEDGKLEPESVFASWWTICEHLASFENATHRNHTKPCNVTKVTGTLKRNPGKADQAMFGKPMAHLPLATEVDFALRFSTYDTPPYNRTCNCTFRNLLEGYADTSTGKYRGTITYDNNTQVPGAHTLHNHVHLYLDGTMSNVPSAANDPTFFLHHCNVDRLLETWIRRYGAMDSAQPLTGAKPGQNRYEHIVPFFPPYSHADMFKRSTELGYDYQELYKNGMYGESDLGECKAPKPEGVSPEVIGMGVGIALGLVLVVTGVAVLLFIWCGPKKQQYHAADTGMEMSVRT
ncbi:tyrosinase-like [Branchiostoma floridae]|uniref:Tyrosinase n=1 Tax=Branchiostoma floridae TaxID=7739 RepID=A0A9J7K628_BRAFL|nr:tyrosinase-like [Branchiostoma floridae]